MTNKQNDVIRTAHRLISQLDFLGYAPFVVGYGGMLVLAVAALIAWNYFPNLFRMEFWWAFVVPISGWFFVSVDSFPHFGRMNIRTIKELRTFLTDSGAAAQVFEWAEERCRLKILERYANDLRP